MNFVNTSNFLLKQGKHNIHLRKISRCISAHRPSMSVTRQLLCMAKNISYRSCTEKYLSFIHLFFDPDTQAIRFSEKSAEIYHITWLHISEDCIQYSHSRDTAEVYNTLFMEFRPNLTLKNISEINQPLTLICESEHHWREAILLLRFILFLGVY